MAEIFRVRLSAAFDTPADTWSALAVMESAVENESSAPITRRTFSDAERREYARDSLTALIPLYVHSDTGSNAYNAYSLPPRRADDCWYSLSAHMYPKYAAFSVEVTVVGYSRMLTEASAKRIAADAASAGLTLSVAKPVMSSTEEPTPPTRAEYEALQAARAAQTRPSQPKVVQPVKRERGRIAQLATEHTFALVVSVVGGVLVIAIAAALGLNAP